ncbi:hypothetical protein EST38_g8363 [Candolleomyces aberdarensis]|uniref:Ricin B lectin domain-containing protein n=1 Tax=Candolleomyces aberdarensis TaxID=2316362 RepID=A0A4Q2DF03_9AGAR|nr:hypothetical protein EST38_g8363 [Candolleomyces aberdarensis]
MASVQITTGVQYTISTPYHDGGYLQFPNQTTSGYATLGSYVEDVSQQWTFEPSDTNVSAFAIANWELKTYASNTDSLLSSSTEPQLWYLTPVDEEFHTYSIHIYHLNILGGFIYDHRHPDDFIDDH